MMAITRPQLARMALKAGLVLERWPEGTVRFTLVGGGSSVNVSPSWFTEHGADGVVYLVGREREPTLADVRSNGAGKRARARFPLLVKRRVVSLETGREVSAVVKAIRGAGWCVANDAYLFPAAGGWLAYVGHHDELVVCLPRGA